MSASDSRPFLKWKLQGVSFEGGKSPGPSQVGPQRGHQNQPNSFCLNTWKKGLEKPERREGSKQVTGPHVRQGDPSRGGSSSHEGKNSRQCADSLEMSSLNLYPDKATSSLVYPLRTELLLPCEWSPSYYDFYCCFQSFRHV